jgi:hypothetical protein
VGIKHWHWGKIAVLWAWGVAVSGPLFAYSWTPGRADSLSSDRAAAFVGAVAILLALSSVTWIWLGGKEPVGPGAPPGGRDRGRRAAGAAATNAPTDARDRAASGAAPGGAPRP